MKREETTSFEEMMGWVTFMTIVLIILHLVF